MRRLVLICLVNLTIVNLGSSGFGHDPEKIASSWPATS